ncbi:MAG TPA: hypothetical protein PLO24_07985 [Bacteroidales bacterium]|jgi:hemerythrin|nr:hypothetical protein [Bacteroidales bacterium]HOS70960.1 hypothetical protein [Bacteroidales bacterium]HQH23270.1 hypothetical protein [Bacteroidales bacterium]HQJ80872.1 hypothetical protein [Bacteroidales bacterium]
MTTGGKGDNYEKETLQHKMTIREDAKQVLIKQLNYINKQFQNETNNNRRFNIHSYARHKSKANPNFFRWLFDDYENIGLYGTNLTSEQKEVYKIWLHNL